MTESMIARLQRAILLHKTATGKPPDMRAAAVILDLITMAEGAGRSTAEADARIVEALKAGAALAKEAARLGCAPETPERSSAALFAGTAWRAASDAVIEAGVVHLDGPRQMIHVLIEGFALCGIGTPSDWPRGRGHRWLGIEDAAFATCPDCLAAIDVRTRVSPFVEGSLPLTVEEITPGTEAALAELAPPPVPLAQWWEEGPDGTIALTDTPPASTEPMGLPPSMDAPGFRCVVTPLLDEVAVDLVTEVATEVRATLRRPRCSGTYIPDGSMDEVTGENCGRPDGHKGLCGPAKPARKVR